MRILIYSCVFEEDRQLHFALSKQSKEWQRIVNAEKAGDRDAVICCATFSGRKHVPLSLESDMERKFWVV